MPDLMLSWAEAASVDGSTREGDVALATVCIAEGDTGASVNYEFTSVSSAFGVVETSLMVGMCETAVADGGPSLALNNWAVSSSLHVTTVKETLEFEVECESVVV